MVAYFTSIVSKDGITQSDTILKSSQSTSSLHKPCFFNKTSLVLLACCFAMLTMTGCHKKANIKQAILPDSSIYSSQNFSDLVLDSAVVSSFLKTIPVSDSLKNEVNQFYIRRVYQFAWFNKGGITDAASNFYSQLQSYSRDFADSSLHNPRLDTLITAVQTDEKQFLTQENRVQQLELLLTTTFFSYAHRVYGGITQDPLDLEWFIPRKKKNYQILLDSLVSLSKGERIQEPVNQYYIRLKEKLRLYRDIQKKGGFPILVTDKKSLSVGDSNACLVMAKQHLLLTGDLKANDNSIVFTDSLAKAITNFQGRMGLAETGKLDLATISELNRPVDFRIKQMMVNMERLRWVPVDVEKDHLLVNIPEFRVHIFENGKLSWAMNVVVGKAAKQTSIFKGNLSQIVLNPYWGIPTSIARNEILPILKRNPSYLSRNNMEVLSGGKVVNPDGINWNSYKTSVPFTFRQKPGKNNALGKIKFLFPNNFHIYLHDTPAKGLFGETKRAFSHGCIRVQEPKRLALYLLRANPTWNEEKVDKILKTDRETIIRVHPTVPVYIAYFTAWVDSKGQLNFRNDLYHLDDKLSKEIFGE